MLMTYGKIRRFSWRALWKMALSGMTAVRNIAIVMLLVGALTALWRACGTVAFIVNAASGALTPELFLPAVFVLCAAVSVLTGTSIGTAATMGVICMGVGAAFGVDEAICGGAILAGAYFGDRCSPVSTSAMLVAEITGTNLHENIRGMIKSGWKAALAALAIYGILGYVTGTVPSDVNPSDASLAVGADNITKLLQQHYDLGIVTLLPAVAILVLAALRFNVKMTMAVSIAMSFAICIWQQQMTATETVKTAFLGFDAPAEISMMNGGGVFGMVKMIVVVAISLTYAGLFKSMGILDKMNRFASRIANRLPPCGFASLTAVASSALSCNQTLAFVLTNEISGNVIPDKKERAMAIENTAVVIAPLVPWTVASLIPLGTIGAPTASILFACYLYLLPISNIVSEMRSRKKFGAVI